MLEQIRANLSTHLKFYRRNRLLLVLSLLFLLLAGLSILFSQLFATTTGRFEIVRGTFTQLNTYAFVFVAALGLFVISSHLRNRNLKMVLTKPCLPETWLGSVFISGMLVGLVIFSIILGFALLLCLIWGIPIQTGFFFLALEGFLQALIVSGYLSFLAVVMHPVPAVLLVVMFNEQVFYQLRLALLTGIKTTGGNVLLPVLEKTTYLIYMVLPSFNPYSDKTSGVQESLRVNAAEWTALGQVALYAFAVLGLFYLLSDLALRRKNLM